MFWLFFFLPLASLFSVDYAEYLESHFKKALGKSSLHQIRNVDFIYTINLDKRPKKFQACVDALKPYNIHPYRFSAVNGWELSSESISSLGIPYTLGMPTDLWGTFYVDNDLNILHHELMHEEGKHYYSHCMSRGAIGIILSHLSVLQDAYDSGFETIWVMEDDIAIIQNPHLISDRIEELDALVGSRNWDILFTDRDTKNDAGEYVPCQAYAKRANFVPANPERFFKRSEVSAHFAKIGARYGAYSMIVRRSGMEKILHFFKTFRLFLPYDMDFFLINNIQLYSVIGDIVSFEPGSPSDNSQPNY